jgi:hypothetical protein
MGSLDRESHCDESHCHRRIGDHRNLGEARPALGTNFRRRAILIVWGPMRPLRERTLN